jgi:hypothetical protein
MTGAGGRVPFHVKARSSHADGDGAPMHVARAEQGLAGFAEVPIAVGADADQGATAAMLFGGIPGAERTR